jgi:hypothetical protein
LAFAQSRLAATGLTEAVGNVIATVRAYLESSPDEPFPLPLLRSGLHQLLETDAPATMKLATLHGSGVLQTTLDTWLKHDPKAAKAWVANPQNQKETKR